MHEFWYDYVKPNYCEKTKLCYMDTDSFVVSIKTDDIYKDIAEDVGTRFDTSNYELDRPLHKRKKKKVIGLIKNELGRKIIIKFVGLRAKSYSYLMTVVKIKKAKDIKKCVLKKHLNLKIIKIV